MREGTGDWRAAVTYRLAGLAPWAATGRRIRRAHLALAAAAAILGVLGLGVLWSHGSGSHPARPPGRLALTEPENATPPRRATASHTATASPVASPSLTPANTPTGTATTTSTVPPPATDTPTVTATATRTQLPPASPTDTASGTPAVAGTRHPTATCTPASTPIAAPSPTVDKLYAAEDTLLRTGPGPAGPLSGLPTRPDLANRRPIAVVIDNLAPDARPQAGLNRASLVFETLAEGGVTRLMAVYLERDAPVVGPVRSARIYFNAWASSIHAIYAHAGGNSDALYQLLNMPNVTNLDDLDLVRAPGSQGPPFSRSPYRAVPHNLYTSTTALRAYAAQAGATVAGDFPASLPHRVPSPLFHRPQTAWIDVTFSSYAYDVHWAYDRSTNTFARFVAGTAQIDAISRRPIAPSNVVVLFTPVTPDHDAFTPEGVNVHATGSGDALYFRDGHVVKGSWRKVSTNGPLQLLGARGSPARLNPGQTWIEVVALGSSVAYGAR
jgi:hypothetical protein